MRRATEPNDNERFFEWWLNDLYSLGLVLDYEFEPQTFVIMEKLPLYYKQIYKRKDSVFITNVLFDELTWTPDYKVTFSKRLFNKLFGVFSALDRYLFDDENLTSGNVYQHTIFYTSDLGIVAAIENEDESYEVWFDVKPPTEASSRSASLGSGRDFKYVQRLLYNKHMIYVNKVVPVGKGKTLFDKTFYPDRYKMNDSNTAPRRKRNSNKKLVPITEFSFFKDVNEWMEEKDI